MRIALTGNPNSGKTTMYNAFTGRNEKVGNWAGVTVEKNVKLKIRIIPERKYLLQWICRGHIPCRRLRLRRV